MKKPKILVLILSGGGSEHEFNERAQRETWATPDSERVEIRWLKADPALRNLASDDSQRNLHLRMEETYQNLLPKTLNAFEWALKTRDFDFILRSNTSSYIDLRLLVDYLESMPNRNLYAGPRTVWQGWRKAEGFQTVVYAGGSSVILSRDVAEAFVAVGSANYMDVVDDVGMGLMAADCSLDLAEADRLQLTDFEPIRPSFSIRVKSWTSPVVTRKRMQEIHEVMMSRPEKIQGKAEKLQSREVVRMLRDHTMHPKAATQHLARIWSTRRVRMRDLVDFARLHNS